MEVVGFPSAFTEVAAVAVVFAVAVGAAAVVDGGTPAGSGVAPSWAGTGGIVDAAVADVTDDCFVSVNRD